MKDDKQNIEELILLYLIGEIDNEEIHYLKNWINESEENYQYYTQIKTTWLLSNEGKNPYQFSTQKAIQKFKQKTNKVRHIPMFIRYAAIFVVALGLGGYLRSFISPSLNQNSQQLTLTNEAEAPYGVRSKVNLPDGSQVWLNSGSKLFFPTTFSEKTRDVKLIGEAYFEVQTNPDKPFIVNANGVNVRALGTSFNVKSYPDEPYVEATLVEGKVLVSKENSEEKPIALKPNQKITIYRDKAKPKELIGSNQQGLAKKISKDAVLETGVNTQNDISWRENIWIIDNEPLSTFAKRLERRYNVKIEFKDTEMLNFRYSGSIKDESISNVLDVISLTSPIIYKKKNNIIVFSLNDATKDKFKDAWR